jgi:hypothetical protein
MDVIVAHVHMLVEKVNAAIAGNWSRTHPAIVRLGGPDDISIVDLTVECERSAGLRQFFHAFAADMAVEFGRVQEDPQQISRIAQIDMNKYVSFIANYGWPFLAGWLLGYPCVYAVAESDSSGLTTGLCAKTLVKYSLSVEYTKRVPVPTLPQKRSKARNRGKQSTGGTNNAGLHSSDPYRIDIWEFTVPKDIFESRGSLKSEIEAVIFRRIEHCECVINGSKTFGDNDTEMHACTPHSHLGAGGVSLHTEEIVHHSLTL